MIKKQTVFTVLVLVILISLNASGSVLAGEVQEYNIKTGEVVFLLDTSESMNMQDRNQSAIDAIRQVAYGLPSNYKTGVVAYGTTVHTVIPFDTGIQQTEEQLASITYAGYTNAGEGLSRAVDLFTDDKDTDRFIIMLTDGEIDMPDSQASERSRTQYTEAAALAREKNIKMFIVAIGSGVENSELHIFDGAEMTNGAIYWEGQSGSLSRIMEKLVADRMEFPRQSFLENGTGNYDVKIPDGLNRVKLVITADGELNQVSAQYPGGEWQTITGKNFAVMDVMNPLPGNLNVSYQTINSSGVRIYMLTEYMVVLQVDAEYRVREVPRSEKEIKRNVPPEYEHFVDVVMWLTDATGRYGNIWKEERFAGKVITYTINGVSYSGELQKGELHQVLPADTIDFLEVSIDTKGLDAVYCVQQPIVMKIEKTPDPVFVPLPDYWPLIAIVGSLVMTLVFLLIFWVRKKNTTIIYMAQPLVGQESARKMKTTSCSYSGKLNMYVVQTADGRDIPPQTYRLFGHGSTRLTLDEILLSCGIKFGKIGARDIILYPGPEHTLIIMDQSESCTVMRGREILKKGMGYPVCYNGKVTVSFEDEATEIELHYKNLKPGEKEGS
ncbi:MAG: VWA domain-containing protein [Hungatella sp.]|jgi:uncharacterized protein YegL|nr:VWA domain-containing protein [Hungatella sp.]